MRIIDAAARPLSAVAEPSEKVYLLESWESVSFFTSVKDLKAAGSRAVAAAATGAAAGAAAMCAL